MFSSVLFVDDDIKILNSFKRSLTPDFNVFTADSPEKALALLEEKGPFPVIVSDMRMPGMNGVELLARISALYPDMVKILLTGYADQQTAIDAVNKGQVFRFLTKPCDLKTLVPILREGASQYQRAIADRGLIDRTLFGVVNLLSQILSLVNPVALKKSQRLKQYCRHLAYESHLKERWLVEAAAMLSQLGCLSISPEILTRFESGESLDREIVKQIENQGDMAVKMLMHIPKLEKIIEILAAKDLPASSSSSCQGEQAVILRQCSLMLRIAFDLDGMIMAGMHPVEAMARLSEQPELYDAALAALLATYDFGLQNTVQLHIRCGELTTKMIIDEEIQAHDGTVLAKRNQPVTSSLMKELRHYAARVGVREPIAVQIPLMFYNL